LSGHAHLKWQRRASELVEEVRQRRSFRRPIRYRGSRLPFDHTSSCRAETNRELLRDKTLVSDTHGAAGYAELSGQILPRGQPRARGEPSVLDALSDRRINLGSQRSPSGTIELDGEDHHRAMVQPELALLVLFYNRAQRICSPTPATGAIPIHQAWREPRSK
jgi:hypothetical protein